ncbi:MAG TPA: DUF58 domain-containing protein [Bacteroidales bacterium]|nr:DUF58 domain-containing protein [Bacteroidales bacterium]HQK36241.1 DUF58 domain-containing protein [Bacteroidales bacterium]
MEATELLRQIRKIEIRTRGLTRHIFAGQYHSAFKGRGIAFSEVREYQFGDDIRTIDWNVTARFNHPYVKVFEEERELTVLLLVDVSGSAVFGSRQRTKRVRIAEIAALLAFSAIQNNDKVGAVLFSDRPEKFIPPKKGRQHILRIIRELIEFQPEHQATNIGEAMRYLTNAVKKRSIVFLISDMYDSQGNQPRFEDQLKIIARKHDLIAVRVLDKLERELPRAGLLFLQDPETGQLALADTADRIFRQKYQQHIQLYDEALKDVFARYGIDTVEIATDQDYVPPLIQLFKKR